MLEWDEFRTYASNTFFFSVYSHVLRRRGPVLKFGPCDRFNIGAIWPPNVTLLTIEQMGFSQIGHRIIYELVVHMSCISGKSCCTRLMGLVCDT